MEVGFFATPLGVIKAVWQNETITALSLPIPDLAEPLVPSGFLAAISREVNQFLNGQCQSLKLPILLPEKPLFYRKVWELAREVPYGTVITYNQLAQRMGQVHAARAVGGAMRSNPIVFYVPCHRIVAAEGALGGFNGSKSGTDILLKRKLLELEGFHFTDKNKIISV